MFSWYKYLIVSLVFSHLGFWSGNLFLIAPFSDLCLLVPFSTIISCGGVADYKRRLFILFVVQSIILDVLRCINLDKLIFAFFVIFYQLGVCVIYIWAKV